SKRSVAAAVKAVKPTSHCDSANAIAPERLTNDSLHNPHRRSTMECHPPLKRPGGRVPVHKDSAPSKCLNTRRLANLECGIAVARILQAPQARGVRSFTASPELAGAFLKRFRYMTAHCDTMP